MSTAPIPPNGEEYSYKHCHLADSTNEIRILTLLPGYPSDSILCTLDARHLTTSSNVNATHYEALSYSWGTEDPTCRIEIRRGENRWPFFFMIRPNLHSALQRLRFPDQPRRLWVDAICINQNDNKEKSSQVPLMPVIYSGAAKVCVWLGEERDKSKLALNFIGRVLNLDDTDRAIADIRTPQEWSALASLMKRDWFSRRWVIQEISLAKQATLHCGDRQAEWSEFAEAVSIFEAVRPEDQIMSTGTLEPGQVAQLSKDLLEMPLPPATRLVDATHNLFRKSDNGDILEKVLSLEVLMSDFSSFQVSRPHDVIYAILVLAKNIRSLQKPSESANIHRAQGANPTFEKAARLFRKQIDEIPFVIDYDKDFLDLCKDFLTFTINDGGSLDILCRPWAPEIKGRALPSWLMTTAHPAFSMRPDGYYGRTNADTLVGNPGQGKRNYNACSTTKVNDKWGFGEEVKKHSLVVDGFVVDVVELIKGSSQNGLIPKDWLDIGGWKNLTAAPPTKFWRTLVADRGPNGSNCLRVYPRACRSLIPSMPGGDISTTTLLNNATSAIFAKFLRRVQSVICTRRLFKTGHHGFLGLAPEKTNKEDLICILFGCSVPVVLRRHSSPKTLENYYEFIGECYVHGLMEGEAFDIQKREREEKEAQVESGKGQEGDFEMSTLTARRTFELR